LYEHYKYYKNFKAALKNNTLFLKLEKQNPDFINLAEKISSDDYLLIKKLFSDDIKKFLKIHDLKCKLDFSSPDDFRQIGKNFIFRKEPISGLWTTGKAELFMPAMLNKDNSFEINLFSIAPLEVEIACQRSIIKRNLKPLSTTVLNFNIPKSQIKEEIIEITIKTDKMWLPSIILGNKGLIPVGVAIKSIFNNTK